MDTITVLASIPAILALTNLAKRLGLPGKAAIALAVVLGIALNVANYLWAGSGLYGAISTGLVMGLGAAGVYDVSVKPESQADKGKPDQLDPAVDTVVVS